MYFKIEELNMQSEIKRYGEKGKSLVIKNMRNLAAKNKCFGKIEYNKLSNEDKFKVLTLLMFIVTKSIRTIKSRSIASSNLQRYYISKEECSSPISDLYGFNYI